MYLRVRNFMPVLVALAWLGLTWRFLLGAPKADALFADMLSGAMAGRFSPLAVLGWFVAMMAAMVSADRLWCDFARWRVGVDPMKTHWSRLRNRDGFFFCARCGSLHMAAPEDGDPAGMVHCGDCGHAIAPFGEMQAAQQDVREAIGGGRL
jgi:hypothetical protein